MHYYKRNIGDYAKKAGRLSIIQHGVYNLLIDACYDREQFPTLEQAIDWVWASSQDEIDAVKFVLNKFFTETDDGIFFQKRIAEEIQNYKNFCETQSLNGKRGGRPKKPDGLKNKPDGFLEEPDGNPSETQKKPKPLTTNQEPLTKNKESILSAKKIADVLSQKIIQERPKEKINPEKWVEDIEKAIRIDDRTESELMTIVNWIFSEDNFWRTVIRSGFKLRKQYDQMYAQMISRKKQNNYQEPELPII